MFSFVARKLPVDIGYTRLVDISGIDLVQIFDNSRSESRPALVLEARNGRIVRLADGFPEWLRHALGWTQHGLDSQRRNLKQQGS
jgi:hypothetical protein